MSFLEKLDPGKPALLAAKYCALGIMTKLPEPGKVKTRLTPPLTPEEAAALNKCFLRDLGRSILLATRQSASRGVAIYTPAGAEASYANFLPMGFLLLQQRGDAFGERLVLAAKDLFAVGFASVCLINSDSPLVPASAFVTAAKELEKDGDRVVLGPSDDGGYYLIGMKKLHNHLFHGIDWSTPRVLAQTLERARELGVEVSQLPSGFDVDDAATLRRLTNELLGDSAPDVAPATQRFLKEIVTREGTERICPA